MAVQLPFM